MLVKLSSEPRGASSMLRTQGGSKLALRGGLQTKKDGVIHVLVGSIHAREVQSKVAIKITYSRPRSLACFPCLRCRANSKGFIIEDSDAAGTAGGTREGDRAGLGVSSSVIFIVLC